MLLNSEHFRIPTYTDAPDLTADTRLIVVTDHLTSQEEELLQKMISSTGLKTTEYIHFSPKNGYLPLKNIADACPQCKILMFNQPPDVLGLQTTIKPYQVASLLECEIAFVDDLTTIGSEQPLKKYIWNLFKAWFVDE